MDGHAKQLILKIKIYLSLLALSLEVSLVRVIAQKNAAFSGLFWVVLEGGAAKPMQSCLSYPF